MKHDWYWIDIKQRELFPQVQQAERVGHMSDGMEIHKLPPNGTLEWVRVKTKKTNRTEYYNLEECYNIIYSEIEKAINNRP